MESKNYQEDLSHIRSMMERGSRFLSLSGLSGVFAGCVALIGAIFVWFKLKSRNIDYFSTLKNLAGSDILLSWIVTGLVILVLAISGAYFLTLKRSKETNQPVWSLTTRRMLLDFSIPLVTGALFCIGLLYHGLFLWLAPATLIFYGLALVSAEKHTLGEMKYLGFCQIILGLISVFFTELGLVCWALGFGILHIFYGLMMHRKYRATNNLSE